MRLTLDITPTLLRSAGVKNHLYYWSRALEASKRSHQIDYYPFIDGVTDLDHDHGRESGIPDWRLFLVASMNARALHPIANLMVRRAQLFHGSPQLRRPPRAAMLTSHIHDLTAWIYPEFHTGANVRANQQLAEHVWRKADGLIAVSESARQDAVRILRLPEDRITVIHHGVPEAYFAVSSGEIDRVRARYRLQRSYVLSLSTIEPRKNLDRLIDAWAQLPADLREHFELIIAGPHGWKAEQTLARLKQSDGGVRYLGYVPEDSLAGLTAGAHAVAYPSLYEGFGFPLAQAMACGVPSITSNVSSMPEVAAGSALLVDPLSTGEIRDALKRMLLSPTLRHELGTLGRAYATAHYRWDRAAAESWAFFERFCD